ncbi:hypothetical protein MSPP1_002611, partial [Malassezia sp. CBS 17886]
RAEETQDPKDDSADATPQEADSSDANPFLVTFGPGQDPRSWSRRYRMLLVVIVSAYTLLSPMTSSMNAPALDTLAEEFHVQSSTVKNMMMSSQVLAFAVGPILHAPLSEQYGRRTLLQVTNILFLILNMGCGFSRTATQMIVLRFCAGLMGSAPASLGAGIVADLFEPEDRGEAMAMYTLSPIMGPCIGPIFSGWIIQGYGPQHWRWIFWVSTMFGALVAAIGLFTVRETYTPVLLERKAHRYRKETGNPRWHTRFARVESLRTRLLHGLMRPCVFLVTQPVVVVPSVYQALLFGCQYILLAEFPNVYRTYYDQPPGIASLHYIAMLVGFLVSGQIGGRWVDVYYRKMRARNGGVGKPEFKLPLLFITGICTPAGLLLYGWSVQYRLKWIVPDVGIFIMACGVRGALFVCPLYLADAVSVYAASAVSALVISRSVFAFSFPLFSPNLYATLGQGWGNSVLALATALIGLPTPFILMRYGEALRQRSSYSVRAMKLMS